MAAVVLAVICVPMLSCKKAPSDSETPDAAATDGGEQKQTEGDLFAELDSLEQEMHRLGLPVAAQHAPADVGTGAGRDGDAAVGAEAEAFEDEADQPPAPSETAADRPPPKRGRNECSNVCDLSRAICELEVQICSLSEGHADDPNYTDACRRAGDDCDTADGACDLCAG
jgi:hypothetical protein